MQRYLVEVTQPARGARRRIGDLIRTTGSHFAARAFWQETGGACRGRLVVETGDSAEALALVPPALRRGAQVVPF